MGRYLSVMTFRTPEEAFERANNTPYGLSAGVWTDKGSKIFKMVNKLRAGVVWANTYNKFDPASPVRRLQGKRFWPRRRFAGTGRVLPAGSLEQNQRNLFRCQNPPLARRQIAQPEAAHAHSQQAQGGMAHRRRHPPHLPVFAFDQLESNPAIRHAFAKADGRRAGENSRRCRARASACAPAPGGSAMGTGCGSSRHARQGNALRPCITTPRCRRAKASDVGVCSTCAQYSRSCAWRGCSSGRSKRPLAQQQQPFGVRVQPADGIDIFRKIKFRQRAVGRPVAGKLRQHAKGFVKRDEHAAILIAQAAKTKTDFPLSSLPAALWLNFPVIRNIIFDWSGTLVDDLPAVLKASNFVLAQSGKPAMSLDTVPRGISTALHHLL